MKGIIAFVVGVALTASSVVVPSLLADENGEVHYWTSSTAYVPPDESVRYVNSETGETVMVPENHMVSMMNAAATGGRVYFVVDDPTYDLSGSRDQLFLVGDGTAFQGSPDRAGAVFASTGGMRHEVAPISSEYRQDWLAVAAGDRPVRTFTAPRSMMDNGTATVSTDMAYTNEMPDNDAYTNGTSDTFRPVHQPRRKAYVHRTVHSAKLSADWRRERRERAASYAMASREDEPEMTMATSAGTDYAIAETVVARDEMGHEIFQIGTSWYMKDNGDWYRAESWRGPFVHVKKGTVPREVRMSADHPSRLVND